MKDNICIITPLVLPVPNIKGGAVETLLTNLIEKNEIEQKEKFTVITVFDKEAFNIAKKYKYTEFIYIKKTKLGNFIDFIKRAFRKVTKKDKIIPYYYKKVFKILEKNQYYDYIIAEGSEERCFNYLLRKTKYKKEQLIAHIHYHRLCEDNIDKNFGKIIAISDFVKKEWLRTSNEKKSDDIKVLMNGIDTKKFDIDISDDERNAVRSKFGFNEDDFVAIYCGRIIEVKGVKELVKAIVNSSNPKIKLLIVGSPNFAIGSNSKYLNEVKELTKQCEDRIKFTGYIDNSKLYQYYKSADVMVVPSLWEEAAGLVCIEGMIAKRPLIITKSGGMVEYVTNDCAIILDRDEQLSDNISKAIEELMNNKAKYNSMQLKGYERAKLFSDENYYENFCKIIKEMKSE